MAKFTTKIKTWLLLALTGPLAPALAISIFILALAAVLKGAFDWPVIPVASIGAVLSMGAALVFKWVGNNDSERKSAVKLAEKRDEAEAKIAKDSKDTQAAWDVARTTLELYFNRNLVQVKQIFVVALAVMVVGFAFVLFGIYTALLHPDQKLAPIVATLAGIVSQFIGVNFMQIHRATMQQANEYVNVLDKINFVGMSVQIIQGVPADHPLSVETRAEMARLLLASVNQPRMKAAPPVRRKRKQA